MFSWLQLIELDICSSLVYNCHSNQLIERIRCFLKEGQNKNNFTFSRFLLKVFLTLLSAKHRLAYCSKSIIFLFFFPFSFCFASPKAWLVCQKYPRVPFLPRIFIFGEGHFRLQTCEKTLWMLCFSPYSGLVFEY